MGTFKFGAHAMKEDAYQASVEMLVQLMRENFTMAVLDPAQVRGRWAVGLRISQQGRRDILEFQAAPTAGESRGPRAAPA